MEEQRVTGEIDLRRIDLIARDARIAVKVRRDLRVGDEDVRLFDHTDDDRRLQRRLDMNEPTGSGRRVSSEYAVHLMVIG